MLSFWGVESILNWPEDISFQLYTFKREPQNTSHPTRARVLPIQQLVYLPSSAKSHLF